jgi:hypothetical protein
MATADPFSKRHDHHVHYFSSEVELRMRREDSFTWTTVTSVLVSIVLLGFVGMSLTVLVTLLGS